MKKSISIYAIILSGLLFSCQKNNEGNQQAAIARANDGGKTICQVEPPRDQQDCGEGSYAPVCACNSVTYSNKCEASNAGLLRWVEGTCESWGGGYPGDGVNR